MRLRRNIWGGSLIVLGGLSLTLGGGCSEQKPQAKTTVSTSATSTSTTSTQKSNTDKKSDPADQKQQAAEPTSKAVPSPTVATTPATPPTAGSPASTAQTETAPTPATPPSTSKVVLGDPSLTAGIPGDGPLTDEQIRAWIEKPENHEPLQIELPVGLSLAAAQISGVDKNPMTRAKIELGRQLYFDPRLCGDATVSCASCHSPDEGFGRHTQFGVGINGQQGGRNSPISYNRILSSTQFWDGRAASLEEQAKGPIANPIEMGNTHEKCVATIQDIPGYKIQFERIFGPSSVNIDTIAAAIATFERALVTGPAPYDYNEQVRAFQKLDLDALKDDDPELYAEYEKKVAAAKEHPMSESALRGRELFFSEKANCTTCHAGANFTDEKYHNLGVGMDKEKPDLGRYEITKDEKDKGAFKTPTIRNVVHSAPYMHDGSQKTLEEVVEWYAKGGHPNPHLSDKIKKLNLTTQDKADLVEFMKACTGEFPKIATARLPE
jgi:cytochrome c peroxidase